MSEAEVTVTGLVEGLAGGWLHGWAFDPQLEGGACEVTVLDDADAVLASGLADLPRTDLGAYGFGRSDFAFRIAVPGLGSAPWLRVYANGAELSGSPLMTGAGLYDGAVSVSDGWAEGWVHERVMPSGTPYIVLRDQAGRCIAQGQAVAGPQDPVFAPAWFRLPLAASVWELTELGVTAEADGVRFATAQARLALRGHLERLGPDGCAGWIMCPEARSVRFEVELYCDDVLVERTTARVPRHDLREAFLDPWDVGFAMAPMRHPPDPALPHGWSLRLQGSGRELFDGPFVTGGVGAHVGAARRLARLGHTQGLAAAERAILHEALRAYVGNCRTQAPGWLRAPAAGGGGLRRLEDGVAADGNAPRVSIVIPVYRDVRITRACIDSVLADRHAATDWLVLVNDCSPDEGMAELLEFYAGLDHVHLLSNDSNLGFVQSVNRALGFCVQGDVLLLNSDTRLFSGALSGLCEAAAGDSLIGTVTALSNNATIFSYPETDAACERLDDIGWDEVATAARGANAGLVLEVPTAHGFCMLIRRAMLDRVGLLDEAFGRGYGEENDLCQRGADLGFRHVAAGGVFVEHREGVSFSGEKQALLAANLARLDARYPEYAADIRAYVAQDGLRAARWPIDRVRLQRAASAGGRFVLVLRNWLQGGTQKAIDEMDVQTGQTGQAGLLVLDLCATLNGGMRLDCAAPRLAAVFGRGEQAALWRLIEGLPVAEVLIHQLLGFDAAFIASLRAHWGGWRRRYYLHDFYPLCPRVTMIDAVDAFCDVAPVTICTRCVAVGGSHEASRLDELEPAAHRALFGDILGEMNEVVAPSASAAAYLARGLPDVAVVVRPHAEPAEAFAVAGPARIGPDIVLLGAMGLHKGSGALLEIARRARLAAPTLRFHVIGYTDRDAELIETGVVTISGHYAPADLPGLVAATGAALALFLHGWPETFSYTLSEAVQMGLIPLVPDIGAPADRVRAAGYGVVFGFPIVPGAVLAMLNAVIEGRIDPDPGRAGPGAFAAAVGVATGA